MRQIIIGCVFASVLVTSVAFAQSNMPVSTDGTDPATWDPAQEATRAAPKNHQVIFENDDIRVLSITVPPGARQQPHHHPWPSVLVVDALGELRDYDGSGQENKLPLPAKIELPLVIKLPPQAVHSVENLSSTAFHATRIEFKKGFPKWAIVSCRGMRPGRSGTSGARLRCPPPSLPELISRP